MFSPPYQICSTLVGLTEGLTRFPILPATRKDEQRCLQLAVLRVLVQYDMEMQPVDDTCDVEKWQNSENAPVAGWRDLLNLYQLRDDIRMAIMTALGRCKCPHASPVHHGVDARDSLPLPNRRNAR